MRKGRLLLSLQAVKHALKLAGPAHPDVHRLVVRLCKAVQQRQLHNSDAPVPPPPSPPPPFTLWTSLLLRPHKYDLTLAACGL